MYKEESDKPGGQVAVHKVQRRKIPHPRRDLNRHVEKVGQTGGREEREHSLVTHCYVIIKKLRQK